ncbi:MAG: DUF58 domain-containing protein, partial [Acidilobus sp.]
SVLVLMGVLTSYWPAALVGIFIFAVIAFDLAILKLALLRPTVLEPSPTRAEASRGSEVVIRLKLKGRRPLSVSVLGKEAREVARSIYEVKLTLTRSGLLEIYEANLIHRSPLRMVTLDEAAPVRPATSIISHPSSVSVLAQVLGLAGGSPEFSPSPSPPLIGPGEEYSHTDELLPSEHARRIDWRATAKRGKLMVKRFYADWARLTSLVIDLTATDDVSGDEMATEAATLMLSLGHGGELSIYLFDGERLWRATDPSSAAIEVLRSLGRFYPEVNRVLDEFPGLSPRLSEADSVEGVRVVAVTQMLSRLPSLLPPGCVIVQPTRPWVWAPTLREAYMLRVRHDRAKALAEAAGCRVFRRAVEALTALSISAPPTTASLAPSAGPSS